MNYRIEQDSMGEVQVPSTALYGAQTERARQNFPISGIRFPRRMIRAIGLIKKNCALANKEKGLDPKIAKAIVAAAQEVVDGKLDDQFPLDIYQTGSGTSLNMNANEVISNRAIQMLGGEVGSKKPVHPNDHVNKGQSSNDIIPTTIHVAACEAVVRDLLPALEGMEKALAKKVKEFNEVVKIGRTHLMDAVPVTLGQEFSGYQTQIKNSSRRVKGTLESLSELALGGTAVGTGLNAEPGYADKVIAGVSKDIGIPLKQAPNLFEALAARDALVEAHGVLKTVAASLSKIANDIRWLGSGPRCGIGEIVIPDLQPGSSIMPGKVNPVMSEMLLMVCASVIGNDVAINVGGISGNFELNVMKPMMGYTFLQSVTILANGVKTFTERCVQGLEANKERCEQLVEQSLALVTALNPVIGYDKAAAISKESFKTGKTIRELVLKKKLVPQKELDTLLDARRMTLPPKPE